MSFVGVTRASSSLPADEDARGPANVDSEPEGEGSPLEKPPLRLNRSFREFRAFDATVFDLEEDAIVRASGEGGRTPGFDGGLLARGASAALVPRRPPGAGAGRAFSFGGVGAGWKGSAPGICVADCSSAARWAAISFCSTFC